MFKSREHSSSPDNNDVARSLPEEELCRWFDKIAAPLLILSDKETILECNSHFLKLFKYSPEDVIHQPLSVFCHRQVEPGHKTLSGEIDEPLPLPEETVFRARDGNKISVAVNASPIVFLNQKARLLTLRDLSREKTARQALVESEDRFKLAFESSGIGKSLSTLPGPFFWVNSRMCELFKYTKAEFLKITSMDLTHPEDLAVSRKKIRKLIKGQCSNDSFNLKKRYYSKTGDLIWAETTVSLLRDKKKNPLYVIVEIVDITAQQNARQAHQELRAYLSGIINSMPSILAGVNQDACITLWNKSACQKTGLDLEDVLGKKITDVFPHLEDHLDILESTISRGRTHTRPKVRSQAGQKVCYEDITVYPLISDQTDMAQGAVIRIDDVTEKARLEEMMIQSEKMVSIAGLAAGMAHEINNPLTGIIQNTQVALSRLTDKCVEKNITTAKAAGIDFTFLQAYLEQRQVLKHLELVHQSGVRAARIVTNMLSFSRKSDEAVFKTLCRIPDLLDTTLELALNDYDLKKLCNFKQTRIRKKYAPETPDVPCEHNKLQQVFFNLLKNAAQAMADFEGEPGPELTILVYPSGSYVIVEIGDNGPGMTPDIQKRVFEPFFTTKPAGKGTGLGLSVSYFIVVKNHNGQMFVKSNPGQGTVFVIKLPVRTTDEIK